MPGTPSAALCRRMPCQWIVEASGSRFASAMRSRSPAVARIGGPGRVSPYAQVETVFPPRSTVVGAAARIWVTTFCPAFGVSAGGGAKPPTSVGAARSPHAASVSAAAPRPPENTVRREKVFTGAVLLERGVVSWPKGVQDQSSSLLELIGRDLSSSQAQRE